MQIKRPKRRRFNRRPHDNLLYTVLHENDVINLLEASVYHKIFTGRNNEQIFIYKFYS